MSKNKSQDNIAIVNEITNIKNNMNSNRIDYDTNEYLINSDNHKINITDNWLLGFIEGDGSFFVAKENNTLIFSISQKGNLILMEAIKNYLIQLANKMKHSNINTIYITKSQNSSGNIAYVLIIKSKEFINYVLIPYFDTLTFYSLPSVACGANGGLKKLDYFDWKSINQLKNLGLHYLPEGQNLITGQMNNNRLSTSKAKRIDRDLIDHELTRLLNGPSNYELREEGKIFIKSLNKYLPNRLKTQV